MSDTWSEYFDVVVVIRQEAAPTFDPWRQGTIGIANVVAVTVTVHWLST